MKRKKSHKLHKDTSPIFVGTDPRKSPCSMHTYTFADLCPKKFVTPFCLTVRILASVTVATLFDSAGSSPIAFNHPGRPPKLRKKRGWSVLDGASRASFCVLAVPLHWQCFYKAVSGPSAYSGERLRSSISLASELRDGPRLASSRFKTN